MYISNPDIYFANLDPYSTQYLESLIEKVNIYREYCNSSGKVSSWKRKLMNYFGISSDGTKSSQQTTRGGDQGQLIMGKINDFRNLIQHQLILVTSQRPAGIAKATNSDTQSLHSARIGSQLVEYYLSQVGWEKTFVKGVEYMKVSDEAFLVLEYDPTEGDIIRNQVDEFGNAIPGKFIKTGESQLRVIPPWNMARDPFLGSPEDMHWGIYSWKVNKFDLAAKFQSAEKEILRSQTSRIKEFELEQLEESKSDMTRVYCLSHEPTQACPTGRITMFVPDAILMDVYVDDGYPYPEFNIYRMAENDISETAFGYTNNNDLLAIEEATDAMHTMIMTNQLTTGMNAILAPTGANIQHTEIAKGLAYFEVDPAFIDKIRTLELCKTAPEIFKYQDMLRSTKETLAGINSVVRGDPEGALRSNSGSALALVQAQSLQFNSGGQRAYYLALSKVNTGHIKILQKYADEKRVAQIVGKNQSQFIEEFKYDKNDLAGISSVIFEAVDPSFQSAGAKVGIAENLLQKGLIKNARQYITVLRTGNLDVFTEDDEADELGVKSENERLRQGQSVQVVVTENHEEHINTHKAVIASPEAKQNPKLVQAVLAHIREHVQKWNTLSQQNPALLIATGQKVLPPPPGSQGPGGAPPLNHASPPANATSSGHEPAHLGGGGNAQKTPVKLMDDGRPAVQTQAGQVNQPAMPTNPLTKQRVPQPMMPSA